MNSIKALAGLVTAIMVIAGVAIAWDDHTEELETEQTTDLEMLAGLGLHTLIRGDHQQHRVDPGGPGDHVTHEALVPGDVHERQDVLVVHNPFGEAQLDRDPSPLLLAQTIGILSRPQAVTISFILIRPSR